MRRGILALLVAGIWIAVLCTAPQLLGGWLARRFELSTALPWRHLLQVGLNSLAVVAFILATRRASLFVPRRPRRPLVLLLFLPLIVLNVLRGPPLPFDVAHYAVILATTILIGFWEEFLFRGLIQERLSVLGPRLSILATAVMFALIHAYRGPIGLAITFSIGLAFCLALRPLGLWPLAGVHCLIDFASDVFVRGWEPWQTVAYVVVGVYCAVGLVLLFRVRPAIYVLSSNGTRA